MFTALDAVLHSLRAWLHCFPFFALIPFLDFFVWCFALLILNNPVQVSEWRLAVLTVLRAHNIRVGRFRFIDSFPANGLAVVRSHLFRCHLSMTTMLETLTNDRRE